jgi:hypothetical protein
MANPLLLAVDLSTYSLSADSAALGFPLSNLQDYQADTYWQSNSSATGQKLVIDFGSAVSADMLVIQITWHSRQG